MAHSVKTLAAFVAVAAFFCGCFGKKDDSAAAMENADAAAGAEPSEEMQIEPDPLSLLFEKAEGLYVAGDTNGTISVLSDALSDEELSGYKAQIFPALVHLLLSIGNVDDASDRVLAAYASGDEMLSDSVLGAIFFFYENQGDSAKALEWTEKVLGTDGIPAKVRRSFLEWNMNSAINADDDTRIAEAAEALFASAPADDAAGILRRTFETLISREKVDLLADIIAKAGKSVTSDSATRDLLSVMRIRLAALQGKWDTLPEVFASAGALPDKELLYALRSAIPLALKANRLAIVDSICLKIVEDGEQNRLSRTYAARQWLDSVSKADVNEVPAAIERLLGYSMQPSDVSSIFLRHAYDNVDDHQFSSAMKPLGERICSLLDEDGRASIRTVLLDYSFLLEDYDAAIAILEDRVPGYDDNWHTMALAKVKAHKALKEDRPLDAVREFRTFMASIQSSEEETSDPATGVVHTRDMILGRNAARIADIYASVQDAQNAAAAYAEARDYYTKALETARDAASIEVIKKELAAIEGK